VYKFRQSHKDELKVVADGGTGTIKIFTTYRNVGYLVEKREELKAIFSYCKDLGLMVSVHAEDDQIITEINDNWKGSYRPIDHAAMRPAEAEAAAILYVGGIAGELDMPVYIVHLSSRKGLEAVRELRSRGVEVICETTPHYLYLDSSCLEGEKGPLYVMTPPLRTKDDNLALREAVANGEIQVVATDHCSFTYDQKLESHDCRTIFPGIPGTEELLPLVHTLALEQGMDLSKVVNLVSTGPAREFGIYPRKGSLLEGTDADFILFDPKEEWVLTKDAVHSASHYTPYEGMRVKGKVKKTFLRGRLIADEKNYYGRKGDGEFIEADR
ncbi:MAG: amidohydrolase family protein, partial [Spirochaetales bacterium]|nr:amidohydrolase family protein [Candidatus Physcosoma equi]